MHDPSIEKYLNRYAQPAAAAADLKGEAFDCALVVPAYDESTDFLQRFLATDFSRSVLMIVVVNAPTGQSGDALNRTRSLLREASQLARDAAGRNRLLILDHVRDGRRLPSSQGVGLARKIGMDTALRLIDRQQVHCPVIWSSDADTRLPCDLFLAPPDGSEAARTFAFRHTGAPSLAAAQRVYDLRLHYYRDQLARCGSPYAFIALGSAIAVSARHYAMVRGMPRRAAGEDFYFLNKLAKTGLIRGLRTPLVEISMRRSRRVPFGTGAGTARLDERGDPSGETFFYDPRCFDYLAWWLKRATAFAQNSLDEGQLNGAIDRLLVPRSTSGKDATLFARVFALESVRAGLAATATAGRSALVRERHLHTWFDGLKTLQSIHRLRDLAFPSLTLRQMQQHHEETIATIDPRAPADYLTGIDAIVGKPRVSLR